MPSRRASGGKGSSPPAYSEVSNSTENNERRRQQIERQISSGSIRLRTGSTGHKPLKNEDVDLEDDPIEVWYFRRANMKCLASNVITENRAYQ